MEYINFARVDFNTKEVTYVTPLLRQMVTNVNGEVDLKLANEYLKQTIPDSENDTWMEVTDSVGKCCGIGYTYDENLQAFIPPKVFNSWVLNTEIFQWEPPIPKPEGNYTTEPFYDFLWNEETLSWEQVF